MPAEQSEEAITSRADAIVDFLVNAGYTHATGVPCSFLKGVFRRLEAPDSSLTYLPAPREDTAVGWAGGLALGGACPVTLMQNSGLGYCLNSFTSFTQLYGFPLLVVMSWRGRDVDAVEHGIIGHALTGILAAVQLPWRVIDPDDPASALDWCHGAAAEYATTAVAIVKDPA